MGSIPRDILREHGYPTEWLGKRRIWGIAHCIKKEYETFGNFCDIQSSGWRFREPESGCFPDVSLCSRYDILYDRLKKDVK